MVGWIKAHRQGWLAQSQYRCLWTWSWTSSTGWSTSSLIYFYDYDFNDTTLGVQGYQDFDEDKKAMIAELKHFHDRGVKAWSNPQIMRTNAIPAEWWHLERENYILHKYSIFCDGQFELRRNAGRVLPIGRCDWGLFKIFAGMSILHNLGKLEEVDNKENMQNPKRSISHGLLTNKLANVNWSLLPTTYPQYAHDFIWFMGWHLRSLPSFLHTRCLALAWMTLGRRETSTQSP